MVAGLISPPIPDIGSTARTYLLTLDMRIGSVPIGDGSPPFVVAELSGNHGGSLETALAIVDAAAQAGAGAIKLQTYTADTMTLNVDRPEFTIQDPNSLWFGRRLYDLYLEASTPWEWHAPLMARAAERGLICFSSPFDDSAVEFLESLKVPAYKVASFECVDLPLIRRVAATGKPLILSTGMATLDEIDLAVDAARTSGCQDLVLLKCTSTYPASPEDSNLLAMAVLRDRYGCDVGLSDHTVGFGVAAAATALGASVIEKHLTLDHAMDSVDGAFSLDPQEFSMLVREVANAHHSLGVASVGPTDAEMSARGRRRSLYIAEDLEVGDVLTPENVARVRPGLGLSPQYFAEVLGRTVLHDVAKGTPLSWDLIDPDASRSTR